MNKLSVATLLSFATLSISAHAAESTALPGAVPAQFDLNHSAPEANENASVPADVEKPKSESSFLPIWGDEARAQGYDIPEPFGINANYMNIRQNIDVKSINFTGLAMGSTALPSSLFDIKVDKTRQRSITRTIKLDAWILPFWNVYGIVGKTRGSSVSNLSVDSDPNSQSTLFGKIIANVIHNMNKNGDLKDLNFKLKFKGTTYGAGTVLAGGYNDWFGLVDMNYTQTRFDILDGSIDAFTVSPRVGYRFTLPAAPAIHLGESHLSLWVGTMYQNVQQEFKGSLNDLQMPSELQSLMGLANKKGDGRFDVKQRLESPWNMLVGANYELTRNFNVTTEIGFAERNSFFVGGEFRF
jgi:hypothetical protein